MGILKQHDYVKILNYYDIPISPKDSSKTIRHKAENILAEKLCKCIKKVKKDDGAGAGAGAGDSETISENESKAVAICSNSIFEKKGLERGLFDCKKKPRLINFHGKKYALTKRKRTLMMSRRTKLLRNFQTRRRKMKK
jgi:methionyl-tRNA formyltransferase